MKPHEVAAFRFGIRWIRFKLTYGREYQIFVRDKNGKEIRIKFKSYFRRRLDELHALYADIVKALEDLYFKPMHAALLEKFSNGDEINIGDVKLHNDGVTIFVSGIISQKEVNIPWENVRLKMYRTYISLYDATNAHNVNRGYNFHEDWNTALIYDVIRDILNSKGIASS